MGRCCLTTAHDSSGANRGPSAREQFTALRRRLRQPKPTAMTARST